MKKPGNDRRDRGNGHARDRARSGGTLLTRRITLSRWGNSLGIRIPREGVQELRLEAGAEVLVEIGEGSITITTDRKKWSEADILRGVTPDMVGGEVHWGGPLGRKFSEQAGVS